MRLGRTTLAVSVIVAGIAIPSAAAAQEHEHDGFLFELEMGAGYVSMPGTAEVSGSSSSVDLSIKGAGAIGGLLLGGTPAPGLVVGGGTQGHYLSSPKVEVNGNEVDVDDALTLGVIGPFVQFYPDPTAGLNFRLLAGYASASGTDDDADEAATGLGVVAGVGHDWWVGEQWSIGVMARFTYANVKYESDSTGRTITQKYNAMVPGAVVTFTYH